MSRGRPIAGMLGVLLTLALVAGACGGDGDEGSGSSGGGGEIVLAVEQWPECLNPITSCANASWLSWSVLVHLQPGLLEFLDCDLAGIGTLARVSEESGLVALSGGR